MKWYNRSGKENVLAAICNGAHRCELHGMKSKINNEYESNDAFQTAVNENREGLDGCKYA